MSDKLSSIYLWGQYLDEKSKSHNADVRLLSVGMQRLIQLIKNKLIEESDWNNVMLDIIHILPDISIGDIDAYQDV